MKRFFTIIIAAVLIISTFVSCGKDDNTSSNTDSSAQYSLGMGVVVTYDNEQLGSASCESVVAAVVLDSDRKIVACKIDNVSPEIKIDEGFLEDGATAKTFTSKYDLGDNYNMVAYGSAKAEWYAQADAFAEYCVGKSVDDIVGTELNNDGKATSADLTASCTIAISDFVKAVEKACKDEQARNFAATKFKLGLYTDAYVKEAKDSEDNDGKVVFCAELAAVAVDADGKLMASVIDAVQPEFQFNDEGSVTSEKYSGSKRELKDNYGMKAYAGSKYEWYEQAASFTDKIVGKTAQEIKAVPLDTNGKTTDADLLAVCSIAISGDIENVIKSMSKAK